MRAMRVCYFGTYERSYPRNALLIAGLRARGVEVVECHQPLLEGRRDKSGAHTGRAIFALALRLTLAYLRLTLAYLRAPTHDVLVVGYVGQLDAPLAWLLSRLRGVPLLFNPMLSLYDTFCDDRALVRPGSLKGRALWLSDHLACRLADLVVTDTAQHSDYFARTFRIPVGKFRVVPLGADDRIFQPRALRPDAPARPTEVLFVGKFIPLHGCETILRAAALLRDKPFHFTIAGAGQLDTLVQRLVEELDLPNVSLTGWIEPERVPSIHVDADICLGVFGSSAKAARVVPNKVYEALAMARPVITADTPATRELLAVGEEVCVCRVADPSDLARQIERLAADRPLRERLACAGAAAFGRRFNIAALADTFYRALAELVPGSEPSDQMNWGDQPEFFGPRHRFRERYLLRAIKRHAPGPVVLDAACGAGSLARALSDVGYRVLGLDLSADFLHYVQRQPGANHLRLLQGDITALPCASGHVDGVVAGEVLEHVADDVAALRECWRVLRPGGVLAVSVPADPAQWNWLDAWAGHVRRYRPCDLQRALERAGFTVLQLHHFGFPSVKAFHHIVYLPHLRRRLRHQGAGAELAMRGNARQLVAAALFRLFHIDTLFDNLPLGIGLIAVARKPDTQ